MANGTNHSSGNNRTDMNKEESDDGSTLDREFASAVLTGTVIGRSLKDALDCLRQEDEENQKQATTTTIQAAAVDTSNNTNICQTEASLSLSNKKNDNNGTCVIRMDDTSVEKILQSFGEAVAESRYDDQQSLVVGAAPRALLQGRCEYHNKFGHNVIISMDQVRIKSRPVKYRKFFRGDKQSLWDRDNDGSNDDDSDDDRMSNNNNKKKRKKTSNEIAVKETIQLLSYGDV